MSFTHKITHELQIGSETLLNEQTLSGNGRQSISETIADSTTDGLVAFALDVSECASFFILADQALTVKTNSSGSPADTLTLSAGVPYLWHTGAIDSFQLGTDVTALYVTNASGEDATLRIEALYDPTA